MTQWAAVSRFWADVIAGDFAVPAGRPRGEMVDELLAMLAAPDPGVRDDTAYPVLATWVGRGTLDGYLSGLGGRLAATLGHPEIQARTFATLILGWVVRRAAVTGELSTGEVRGYRDSFASWWSAEEDLRGYDPELGWLHAAAHGADTVRAFARSPRMDAGDLAGLLDLTTRRITAPTRYLFADNEDQRLAHALAAVLCRPELADPTGWLAPVRAAIQAGEPGPVPAWAANTLRTLAALYVVADRGMRWYDPVTGDRSEITMPPPAVRGAVADVLRLADPYLG